jgi:hypothetical protein
MKVRAKILKKRGHIPGKKEQDIVDEYESETDGNAHDKSDNLVPGQG